MIKQIILLLFVFALGFFTHALFFPDFLSNGIIDIQQLVIPKPTTAPNQTTGDTNNFMSTITFKDGQFNRHNITIGVGNYLLITNISADHPMWLESNNPLLATVRGYGQSEQIRVRMDQRGQFVVADKHNPDEKLVITVK